MSGVHEIMLKGSWQSNCQCVYCETCNVSDVAEFGDKCDNCGNEFEPYGDCYGECYEDDKRFFEDCFNEWLGDASGFVIHASRMTWRNISAISEVLHTAEDAIKCLDINGDLRLEWEIKGDELTATRYSHDEPTGAFFTFDKEVGECDECGDVYNTSSRDGRCGDCGLCGDCCHHENKEGK